MTLPIQQVLEGKYEILEKIGEGGIGTIYKVRHRLLEEIRVIKVLRQQTASEEGMDERFLHEARMAIQLKHQNIAQLHDFAISEEGRAYIVMEYIDGVSLDDMFKAAGAPSLDLGLEIASQSLDALGYLHAHAIVHRDVALDNLMITTDFEGNPQVKLIDLGIAKNLGDDSQLTQTGVFVGKVQYCSPEQFSPKGAEDPIDHRSDLYSFGVVLYKLLTGEHPFSGETFAEFAGAHLFQPPLNFETSDPAGKLPESLRQALLKALEKDRDDRFASASDFRAVLAEHRNADAQIKEEFEAAVAKTAEAIPHIRNYAKPGSTQAKLNAQFGLETTPAPAKISAITSESATLAEARTEMAPMPTVDGAAQAAQPAQPARHARPTRPTDTAKKLSPALLGGIGAVALLVAGGLWFAFGRSAEDSDPVAERVAQGASLEIEQAPTFDAAEVSGEALNLTADALAVPVTEDEIEEATEEPVVPTRQEIETPAPAPVTAAPVKEAKPATPKTETATPKTTEVYAAGPGVSPPALVAVRRPVWPSGTKAKDDVDVIVTVLVSETGSVISAAVKKGPTFRRKFKDEALSVARAARFRPAMRRGIAGRMQTDLRVVFKAP